MERAFAEIKNSEDRLRTIIDAIPAQVWSQRPDGTINYVNRRWLEYTGLSPKEAYGADGNGESVRPVTATDVGQAIVHPEDLPSARAKYWEEILPAGKLGEFEVRLRRHDGEYRWFMVRVEAVRDERGKVVQWYGTNTDIEDLKRAEAKLRQDEQELRRITDAIPQSIIVLSPEGTVVHANRAVLEYTSSLRLAITA